MLASSVRSALYLGLCSSTSGQGLAVGENPVIEVYMYRSMAYNEAEGVPYAMANVNMGDLPGVTQYMHREIITDHQIQEADTRTRRKYDISHIMRWRFLVKNPADMGELDAFVTYDFGQATNEPQWVSFQQYGDFVGKQPQIDTFVKFTEPSYWFSVSGDCPSLPYTDTAVTAVCSLDDSCPSKLSADEGCLPDHFLGTPRHCLCTSDGERVAGGLCNPGPNGGPPEQIVVPTGEHGCVYSYDPLPEVVSWDEIAGITAQRCADADGERECSGWADFRANCVDESLKRTFSPMGEILNVAFCVEYDLHPYCMEAPQGSTQDQQGCNNPACQAMNDIERELGLPFWQGRCTETANRNRAEMLAEAFGVESATESHHIMPPHTAEYADVECKHIGGVCEGNENHGESFCTRHWGGVCTACRIPGPMHQSANRDTDFCPWDLMLASDYHDDLASGNHCRNHSPRNICCLYSNTCDAPYDDLNNPRVSHLATGELNEDTGPDMLAFAMAVQARTFGSMVMEDLMLRIATELLEIPRAHIDASQPRLGTFSYWSWGLSPPKDWVLEQWDGDALTGNVASLNFHLVKEELQGAIAIPPPTPAPPAPAPAPAPAPGGGDQPGPSPAPTPEESPQRIHAELTVELTPGEEAGTAVNAAPLLTSAVDNIIREHSAAADRGCTLDSVSVIPRPARSATALLQLRRLMMTVEPSVWSITVDLHCTSDDVSDIVLGLEDADWWSSRLSRNTALTAEYRVDSVIIAGGGVQPTSPPASTGVPAEPTVAPAVEEAAEWFWVITIGTIVVVIGCFLVICNGVVGHRLDGEEPPQSAAVVEGTVELGGVAGSSS